MCSVKRFVNMFNYLGVLSIFLAFPAFAAEQIVVADGETYNMTEDSYENYQNESLNGGVVTVSGTLNVTDTTTFTNNEGLNGGVIYNEGIASITTKSGNSLFGANTSDSGGAIYNADTGVINEISHALFQRNQSDSGGAINNANNTGSVGGGVINKITNASFIENSVGQNQGGAINNQGSIGTIETVAFVSNMAGNGGAINNNALGKIGTISATFNSNKALSGDLKQGGAIANYGTIESITDSVFNNNRAGSLGGAIYNSSTGNITFNGTNSFTGNFADGAANDIYNEGQIVIADGTTTIGGGISGNGSLSISNGATLSIGSTTLEQGTLNLDGILSASIVNQDAFGKIKVGTINIGETGKFDLMLGAAGSYDFGTSIGIDNLVYNDSIYNVAVNGTNIIVETKSVDSIVNDTGLSSDAAIALVGLANSSNYSMNIASLNAQSALLAGNEAYVESEAAKLRSESLPVIQSVGTTIQNQIFSLVSSSRLGKVISNDESFVGADYGIWVNGLKNRIKYSDKFTGNADGVSVGFDTLIKNKYAIGVGFAYDMLNVNSNTRETEITSNSFFLYGQYKPSNWYINAVLNYSMASYEEMATAFGIIVDPEYDVDYFGGQIMTGYDFAYGFTPEIGMRYLHIAQENYENGFANIEGQDTNYVTGIAGLKYSFPLELEGRLKLLPEMRAAVTYDFIADDATTTIMVPGGVSYIANGERLSELGGEFGLGVSAIYNEWQISLNYDLDLREDYTSQTGSLQFKYRF